MSGKTIAWVGGMGILVGLALYLYFDKNLIKEAMGKEEDLPPAEEPPNDFAANTGGYGPDTGIGSGVNTLPEKPLYLIDEGRGKTAVQGRMRTVFNNKTTLMRIIRENGILNSIYNSLQYPAGMQQVIISAFGTKDGLPLVPPTIDGGAYVSQLESLKALDKFNDLERGGRMEMAKTLYINTSTLPGGVQLIPGNIQMFLDNGFFGAGSSADSNGSNLWERYCEDLKVLADKLINASLDLENVLRDKAVQDLVDQGWSFANA